MAKQDPLNAIDVVSWDYLVQVGEYVEERAHTAEDALRGFAYAFTSTADEEIRNTMLLDILKNGTRTGSVYACEDFVSNLASWLHCDPKVLRQFAKERGVRLRRG
jgi:hypothetical protein